MFRGDNVYDPGARREGTAQDSMARQEHVCQECHALPTLMDKLHIPREEAVASRFEMSIIREGLHITHAF